MLADRQGTVWVLDTRDASTRRGGQSLIAEAPCTTVDPVLCERVRSTTVELIRSVGYVGAATVVYRFDGSVIALTEVDCVAASEHATTEERTGASIIGWRLRIHGRSAAARHTTRRRGGGRGATARR